MTDVLVRKLVVVIMKIVHIVNVMGKINTQLVLVIIIVNFNVLMYGCNKSW